MLSNLVVNKDTSLNTKRLKPFTCNHFNSAIAVLFLNHNFPRVRAVLVTNENFVTNRNAFDKWRILVTDDKIIDLQHLTRTIESETNLVSFSWIGMKPEFSISDTSVP